MPHPRKRNKTTFRKGNTMARLSTKYDPDFARQALNLALLSATDAQLAEAFQVTILTINNWKKKHKPFAKALREGKVLADSRVAASLFKRALGYERKTEKIYMVDGQPVRVETVEHIPADVTAARHWLNNRQPELWRDRVEHTGANGEPIEFTMVTPDNPRLREVNGGSAPIIEHDAEMDLPPALAVPETAGGDVLPLRRKRKAG